MKGYGQFCPVAKASEIIGERWTPLVLRELLCGSRHFNDLRRGVPLMSQSLLSQRLKALQRAGIIERVQEDGRAAYTLTRAGEELRPLIEGLGHWGQRWAPSLLEDEDLDAGLLMWDIKRNVDAGWFHEQRTVIAFDFTDVEGCEGAYWLVGSRGEVELCMKDPGFPVDLYVTSDLRTLTSVWLGRYDVGEAVAREDIELHGDRQLATSFRSWFTLSPMAKVERPHDHETAGRSAAAA